MKPRIEIRYPISRQIIFVFGKPCPDTAREDFFLNHARSGILLALKSLDLGEGSKVGVMAYNCHTVFNAIAQAECTPVFIDVTDDLTLDFNDLRKKASELDALVVSHLFGITTDVLSIKKEFPGLVVIEDCAHAYGLKDRFGDFSVDSIGMGKFPSIGDGGILHVHNNKYLSQVDVLFRNIPDYSFTQSLTLHCSMCIKALLYIPSVYSLITKRIKKWRGVKSNVALIIPTKMCPGINAVYNSIRPSLETICRERVRSFSNLKDLISNIPGVSRVIGGSVNGFMLVTDCKDVSDVRKSLAGRKIEAETHFAHCIDWAESFGYIKGSCPNTERLTGHLLMVPTYI